MKTIKLKVTFNDSIEKDIRIYSSIVRYAFNRFQDGLSTKEVYTKAKSIFDINSHPLNCAIREANSLYKLQKDKKVIFGDFIRRAKNLITKDEYKKSKLRGFCSEGEKFQKGNRLFSFDIENEIIVYKRSKKEHISLKLPKLKNNIKRELFKIQNLMEQKIIPITIKLHRNYIFITYDNEVVNEELKLKDLKKNRVLGIDLNPNYIGFSVLEFDDNDNFSVLKKGVFDVSSLNKKFFKNWFYPILNLEKVKNKFNQWKEEIYSDVKDWKDLFQKVKKSGMRYRFQLNDCDAVFKRFYHKMNVATYFYI